MGGGEHEGDVGQSDADAALAGVQAEEALTVGELEPEVGHGEDHG
jgi:hypothetical protein